jgi:hypothetical protein
MKRLSINDILNAEDYKTEMVSVPEWGGEVEVATMSAEAKDAYEISLLKLKEDGEGFERDLENARAKMVAACVVDEHGNRMFKSEAQVKALGSKSAAALDRVFDVCKRLNHVSNEDIEELSGN